MLHPLSHQTCLKWCRTKQKLAEITRANGLCLWSRWIYSSGIITAHMRTRLIPDGNLSTGTWRIPFFIIFFNNGSLRRLGLYSLHHGVDRYSQAFPPVTSSLRSKLSFKEFIRCCIGSYWAYMLGSSHLLHYDCLPSHIFSKLFVKERAVDKSWKCTEENKLRKLDAG